MRKLQIRGLSFLPTKADRYSGTSNFMGRSFSGEDFLLQCQIYSLVKDSFSWEPSFIIKEEGEQCLPRLG